VSALKYKSREKRQALTKQHEEDWNFNRGELPLHVSVCCTVCEQSKMRQKSFRFIRFSSSFDNVWFHTFCFCALPRLPSYYEGSNNPKTTTTLEDWFKVVWIAKKELNKLWRGERLKVLARIPEQWWEMNQRMTLKVRNLTYEVQSDLVVASIAQVPLSGLTSLCHLSLFTSIYQIPDFLPDSVKSHVTTVSYVI